MTSTGKNPDQNNIVAYKNGKKLPDDNAKKLYQQLLTARQAFAQMQANLWQNMYRENMIINPTFAMPFPITPVIIIDNSDSRTRI